VHRAVVREDMIGVTGRRSPARRRQTAVRRWFVAGVVLLCLVPAATAWADEMVLVSGRKYRGLVVKKTPKYVVFKVNRSGGAKMIVTYPIRMIASLKVTGEEPVVDEPKPRPKPEPRPIPKPEPEPTSRPRPGQTGQPVRTRAEIDALIEEVGRTPPAWWDSVSLNYPQTLDLTGTYQSKQWEPRKKLGAYVFSVVIPNPRRWRGTIKLLHRVLGVRKDDPPRLAQAMNQLANAYSRFEKDWARGAFWYRKGLQGSRRPSAHDVVGLAECYLRLGSKAMSAGLLRRYSLDRMAFGGAIKLWTEMGETDRALRLADAMTRSRHPAYGWLLTGNIYRRIGKYTEAVTCFEKVVSMTRGNKDQSRTFLRAQGNIEAIKLYEALDLSKIPDGTYTGTTVSFRGPLTVQVVLAGGRMESVKVTRHKDDIFFTSLTDIPQQIVKTQGLKDIDAISGATVTSMAIVNAAAKALASGMQ